MSAPAETSATATPAKPDTVVRFGLSTRWVHRTTSLLMGTCLVTAAMLYVGPLSQLVGRRELVRTIHIYAGIGLPLPALAALAARAFRADLRALNRFHPDDWRWLRSRDRRDGHIPVGKFNAGQKLFAAFVGGSIVVMLGTGLLMWRPHLVELKYRTGATFVHDWLAIAIFILVLGHLRYALADIDARRGMRTGRVPRDWAVREHARWIAARTPPRE
jgi:formate dehydrogenase subunit gamma